MMNSILTNDEHVMDCLRAGNVLKGSGLVTVLCQYNSNSAGMLTSIALFGRLWRGGHAITQFDFRA